MQSCNLIVIIISILIVVVIIIIIISIIIIIIIIMSIVIHGRIIAFIFFMHTVLIAVPIQPCCGRGWSCVGDSQRAAQCPGC
jgi:hypothetical protein